MNSSSMLFNRSVLDKYLSSFSMELVALSQTIERLDTELDGVVFGLYGLTEDEVRIVEWSER